MRVPQQVDLPREVPNDLDECAKGFNELLQCLEEYFLKNYDDLSELMEKAHTQNTDHTITDADGDTKVQVEKSADEDKVRVGVAGTETAVFGDGANEPLLELDSSGSREALKIVLGAGIASGYSGVVITSSVDQNRNLLTVSESYADATAVLVGISNDGKGACLRLDQNNTSSTASVFYIYNASTGNSIQDDSGAHLTAAGVWTDASEGELKTNFKEEKVLDKIRRIAVRKYQYKKFRRKGERKEWRGEVFPEWHFSPVAEDFHRVFGLGDGKGISAKSLAGVALQGLKELAEKVERLERRIERLERRLR